MWLSSVADRSYFKSAFWSNLCVVRKFQSLELLNVFTPMGIGFAGTSGLIFAAALTLNQNPFLK